MRFYFLVQSRRHLFTFETNVLNGFVSHRFFALVKIDEHHPSMVVSKFMTFNLERILDKLGDFDVCVGVSISEDQWDSWVIKVPFIMRMNVHIVIFLVII